MSINIESPVMASYRFGDRIVDLAQQGSSDLLVDLHAKRTRLFCLCSDPPGEMYLAQGPSGILVKRMPNSGDWHAADCVSYEPPAELSGLGDVLGSAIREDPDTGSTALRFGFSLSKGRTRAAPAADMREADAARSDVRKLGLRALLHYLWDEAGFTRWRPAMRGKRNWAVIHRHLIEAAATKTVRQSGLGQHLFVPEPFAVERKDEIQNRRRSALATLSTPLHGTVRRLMIVIAEIKEIASARYGYKLVLRHLPDFNFMLPDELHRRMIRTFSSEIDFWNAVPGTHLVVAGTFSVGGAGYASMEELALMSVDENWLPASSAVEKRLLDTLVSQSRSFVRLLRYNLASNRPLGFATLSDTKPGPVVLYLAAEDVDAAYSVAQTTLIESSRLASWTWKAGQTDMPSLPSLPPRSDGRTGDRSRETKYEVPPGMTW